MKSIKPGSKLTMKVSLPEDLPWKIFGSLLRDLGFTNSGADAEHGAFLADKTHVSELLAITRSRNYARLLKFVPVIQPQSMLENVGTEREAYQFFAHYQASAFLKKFPFKGVNTLDPAIQKFEQAERICGLYNTENYRSLEAVNEKHPDYLGVIDDLRQDIQRLLGEFPKLESIYGLARHGPGTSLGPMYAEGKTTSFYKWSNLPYSVTADALAHAKEAISLDPRWIGALDDWYRRKNAVPIGMPIDIEDFWSSVFVIVNGSKITTVPKTALTDRTIAIEPLANLFIQLGVDGVIKGKLKRLWKIDLSTQEVNQKLAEESSIANDMATVDLSAASDSISLKICEMLLPGSWYNLLLELRSPVGVFQDKEYTYEKISSMGNGFTFALETVIFAALTRCAIKRTGSEKRMAVYGDDIVVPSTAFEYLATLLNLCGFDINKEKSFVDGPFRESCGADFYLGHNVRPVSLKRKLSTIQDLLYAHNSMWVLQDRLNWAWCVDLRPTMTLIRKYIPQFIKDGFYGPAGETLDTHLFSDRVLKRNTHGERVYNYIRVKARKFKCDPPSFFFRKLMASLRGDQAIQMHTVEGILQDNRALARHMSEQESRNRAYQRGFEGKLTGKGSNAFDITRRNAVLFVSARCRIP